MRGKGKAGNVEVSNQLEAIKANENGMEIVEVGSHRKGIVEELKKAHIYIEQLHKQMKVMEQKMAKLESDSKRR